MSLCQADNGEVSLVLEDWVESGHVPLDPHEHLLLTTYQTQPESVWQPLLEELRRLGRRTPLRYRDFSTRLKDLFHRGQARAAIEVLLTQARSGDEDALRALLRALVESQEYEFEYLIESVRFLNPQLWQVRDFLDLYPDQPRLAKIQERLWPEISPLAIESTEPPKTSTSPAMPNISQPSWSLRRLSGRGTLSYWFGSDPLAQVVQVENESIASNGFKRFTFQRSPKYYDEGDSRIIRHCLLGLGEDLLLVNFHDGSWELLNLKPAYIRAEWLGGEWSCLGWRDSWIWVGGPEGIFRVDSQGPTEKICSHPVESALSFEQDWFGINPEGQLWSSSGFQLPDNLRARAFSARGALLAASRDDGQLQIWNLQRQCLQAICEEAPPLQELAFSSDGQLLLGLMPRQVRRWSSQDGTSREAVFPPEALGIRKRPVLPIGTHEELAQQDRFFDQVSPPDSDIF